MEELRYQPVDVERRWQNKWVADRSFEAGRRTGAPRRYVLEMFPYPSGAMHMGHVRVYTLGDVIARHLRMQGFDVLHPMGYDAFGLPAENAAIKDGLHPAVRTPRNIESFREDLQSLGISYDWTREISTAVPEYYRWNQWFFLRMRERGIVYRRSSRVNWCPGCSTVLANEQVLDGLCWRCDSRVEDRRIPEWAFRITAYADELLKDLDGLTHWPERITSMQRHWIGRSEGTRVEFGIESADGTPLGKLPIFTTRVDTIFGCTYVVIAPEHPLLKQWIPDAQMRAPIDAFAEKVAAERKIDRAADQNKQGLSTGLWARNPWTGERIPLWAANFVVADYGTGAVMSVPAHDQRDFEFARAYGLPLRTVIGGVDGTRLDPLTAAEAFTDDGVLVDSGDFSGLTSAEARTRLAADAEARGFGGLSVSFRIRDWGFSRQRYWGTPIPIVYCESCDPAHEGIPVPDDQLPVRLPSENEMDVREVLSGTGEPPLAKIASFVHTTCPRCAGPARRECETMDTFVDSCWYFARFLSPHDETLPVNPADAQAWLPVSTYIGGPEHAVLHLLYFRFWTKVMNELGLVPVREPVHTLVTQGIVNGPDGRKMSKRLGNVVSPRAIVGRYGADVTRLFILFAGPPQDDMKWSDEQVEGIHRFVHRVWRQLQAALPVVDGIPVSAAAEASEGTPAHDLRKKTHKTIKKITRDLENLQFNVCVAALMELSNTIADLPRDGSRATAGALREALESFAVLAQPLAPHLASEMWSLLGRTEDLQTFVWPAAEDALTVDNLVTYAVQVNGKLRSEIQVAATADEAVLRTAAESDAKAQPHLAGKTVRKVIVVKGRLINFVVA